MAEYVSKDALKQIAPEGVWEAIDNLKNADVVPVVRCADCKYLNEDIALGEWDGSCRFWNTHSVTYSWFCSQGERKKDGEA